MVNVFMPSQNHSVFSWEKLGDIKTGRKELGEDMPVLVYRLFEYSINDVLHKEFGSDRVNKLFNKTGHLAGTEYAKNMLPLGGELNEFMSALQQSLKNLKIGILKVEKFSSETGEFILTVAEDLGYNGLPPTNEVVCNYNEGFISGIMEAYTGKPYLVREIDCWVNGYRVCRFKGNVDN